MDRDSIESLEGEGNKGDEGDASDKGDEGDVSDKGDEGDVGNEDDENLY